MMGLQEKLLWLFLKRTIAIGRNWLLMKYWNTHKPLSMKTAEAFSCSIWKLTWRNMIGQCAENERLWTLSPKYNVFITSLFSRIRKVCGRGGEKIVKARDKCDSKEKLSFWRNRTNTPKNSLRLAACIRPVQVQTRQGPSIEKGN